MSPRAGSLLEIVVALAAFSLVLGAVLAGIDAASAGLSLTGARSAVLTEAERSVALLAGELRNASLLGPPGVELRASGLQPASPQDGVLFSRVEGLVSLTPPRIALGPRRELRFEADGAELPRNGLDDDRDGLVDEGRLVLATSGGEPVVLLADVSAFSLSLDPGPPGGLPTLELSLTLEQPLRVAVRDAADAERFARGQAPRTRHVSRAVVPVLN